MKKTLAKTWTPTNNRFIAFFDYLGFSNFVLRNDHSSVLKRMEKIHGLLNDLNLESRGKYLTIGETDKDPISIGNYYSKATMFSDSFVIFSEDDSTNNLTHLLLQCIKFMQKCIYYGIPVKGAISHGNVTADVDKNIFFGKALIDAYHLEGEFQSYGIVLDRKAEKYLKKYELDSQSLTHEYNVPFKGGKTNHFLVNWIPQKSQDKRFCNELRSSLIKLKDLSSGIQRKYIDNTIRFYNDHSVDNDRLDEISIIS